MRQPRTLSAAEQRRKAEYDQLFKAIPGRNIEKIRAVCRIVYCKEQTVRVWNMGTPQRVISDKTLNILRDGLAREGITAAAAQN